MGGQGHGDLSRTVEGLSLWRTPVMTENSCQNSDFREILMVLLFFKGEEDKFLFFFYFFDTD